MRQTIYPKTRTTRELRKSVKLVTGKGFTSEPDGREELYYETSIDLDALHQMAIDAAGNKSGVSNDGPLRVRIIERRKLGSL